MTTEGGGERYQLNMLQGTVRTKDIVFQNLGEEEKTITLECEKFSGPTNLCDIIEFKTKTFTLEKLKDIKQSVSFAINIPEDYEKSDYVVNIFAADENGITKSITTEVNVETFGILTKGVIKLGSYKKIGNLVFPYILIFLIIFVSLSMLFSFLLKKAKVPGNVGFGIVLALFVSLLITLFI